MIFSIYKSSSCVSALSEAEVMCMEDDDEDESLDYESEDEHDRKPRKRQ